MEQPWRDEYCMLHHFANQLHRFSFTFVAENKRLRI